MKFKDFIISDLFSVIRGKSIYTRDYAKKNHGEFPIYSAGRGAPLATIDTYDHDGEYLSWTTNGYAGYVQVLKGKFSINSDRGLLVPLDIDNLSLDYCRLILQPKLRIQAIGRIIDGKKNEYTKLSPTAVSETSISLPIQKNGQPDKNAQEKLAKKYLKLESFQKEFEEIHERVSNSSISITIGRKFRTLSISNSDFFKMEIGNRVLKKDIENTGIPVYSANVIEPFGYVKTSNIKNFSKPALLWGIDGNFEWNYIHENIPFATTDHCGVLYITSSELDSEYIYYALLGSKDQYGFDRTFRASLENMKEVVQISVPIDKSGKLDIKEQKTIAQQYKKINQLKITLSSQLENLIESPITFE